VLVVNGNNKSGVKYTADYAFDYGVKVFAIPYSVGVNSGEICNSLIKKGAYLVTDASEILSQYLVQKIKEETIEIELSSEESEILELIKESPKHIEEICVRLNKAIYEVAPILSMLEIKGVIVKVGVNIYGRLAKTEE
jgi:DNA processing protein